MLDINLTIEIWGSDSCIAEDKVLLDVMLYCAVFLTCLTLQMMILLILRNIRIGWASDTTSHSRTLVPSIIYLQQDTTLPLTATAAYCSYTLILTWRCENVSSRGGTVTSRVLGFIVCLINLHMEICSSGSKKNSNTLFMMMTSAETTTSGLSAIFASTISIRSCGRSTMSNWSGKR